MSKNIVFIDSRVAGYETLIASLSADSEWHLLDAAQDGLDQMQRVLEGCTGLDSIHIVSHGASGTLYLGSTVLNSNNLGSYQTQLQTIGSRLDATGDILLYGCDVALGEAGVAFVDALARITGAEIAASHDPSGQESYGGDSILEVASGSVETQILSLSSLQQTLAANTSPTFFTQTGQVTTDFGSSGDYGDSVSVQADGKILVAGYSNTLGSNFVSPTGSFALVRYNADGTLDTSFSDDGKVTVSMGSLPIDNGSSIVQVDGKVLIAGSISRPYGKPDFALVRYNTDGTLDASFSDDGMLTADFVPDIKDAYNGYNYAYDYGYGVAMQADGKILVAGRSDSNFALARYNNDGTLDISFSGDGEVTTNFNSSYDTGTSVAVQADGKILVGGSSYVTGGNSDFALVRYNTDGTLDTEFSDDGKVTTDFGTSEDYGNSVTVQADGKILVVGQSYDYGTATTHLALARYNTDGTLDITFSQDGTLITEFGSSYDTGSSVAVQADGKILVAGTRLIDGSSNDFVLARYNAGGTLDTSFGGDGKITTDLGLSDDGRSVKVQADGKILVAGSSGVGNDVSFALVRYNTDGSLDTSFSSPRNTLQGQVTYTEYSPSYYYYNPGTPVALAPQAQIRDLELAASGNYAGATLTLSRHGGANAQDFFSALSGGTLSALATGTYFSVEGTTVGRVTNNADGSLSLVFNANATPWRVNRTLEQIAYSNTSDTPPASVEIDWTFSDGNTGKQGIDGALSVTSSSTVNIIPTNDPPVTKLYGLPAQTVSNGELFTYTLPSDVFFDPDGDTLTYSVTMSDGTALLPWLTIDAVTGTLTGTPDTWDVGTFYLSIIARDGSSPYATSTSLQLTVNGRPTGDVSISGKTTKGHILTATYTLVDVDGLGTVSYQWLADGVAINGATYSTFTLTQAQVGKTITVTASYTDNKGTGEVVSSNATPAVTAGVNTAPNFGMGDGKVITDLASSYDEGYSISVQADGKILVAGNSFIDGSYDFALVRYHADGTLDASFSGDGKVTAEVGHNSYDSGNSVATQVDGRILVAGTTSYYGVSDFALVRYNSDGMLDTSFSGDGMLTTDFGSSYDHGQSVTVQSDGKILVAGWSNKDSSYYFALVRYNSDGTLDTSFSGDGMLTTDLGSSYDNGESVTVQSDGKILVAGSSNKSGGHDFAVVRYNSDGTLDTSFSGDGMLTTDFGSSYDIGQSVTLQSDGKILVAGWSDKGGSYDFALVRYNSDGSLDTSFSGDGMLTTDFWSSYDIALSVTVQSDGKILVAGWSNKDGSYDIALVRYNSDGTLDTSFSGDGKLTTVVGSSRGSSVTVQVDGKILVAGASDNDLALVRYNPDGSLDLSFDMAGVLGGSVTYAENFSPVVLDSDVQIHDPDLTAVNNYDGATLILARHGGAQSEDHFSGAGIVAAQASGDVTISGITVGSFTWDAGTLTIAFNNSATQVLVNQTAQAIAYQNTNDAPVSSIQIDWTFSDGNTGTQGSGGELTATGSTTVNITPVNDAPTGDVTTSGTVKQGQTLTAAHTLADADGMGTVSYQWLADGQIIPDATDSTLVLGQAQVGKAISVVASYTDGFGTSESKASAGTSAIANTNDTPTGVVSINGTVQQGHTLTASNTLADVDGMGAVSYQWKADGNTISGATGSTFVPTQAQVGKVITVTANYTDWFGTAESVTSSATAAVTNTNDAPSGSVTITGVTQQGQTLTASNSLADADGMGAISYQWKANGQAISNASDSTWELTQAQVGKNITVVASYTDGFGTSESKTSAATTPVTNINDAPSGNVTITGTATQGQTLSVDHTLTDVDGMGTVSYQWKADGTNISGATSSTLTLTQAQVDKAINVVASYTDALGAHESVSSTSTEAVANTNDVPTGALTVTGSAIQGQTLTAVSTLADADGLGDFEYQWLANGQAIAGAHDAQFTLTQAEVGKNLSVTVSYTDGFGGLESKTSAATAPVANVNDAPGGNVTINGTTTQGQTLTAANTLTDLDGMGTVSYQWQANGINISGATDSAFALTQAQVGKAIRVVASYTDGLGRLESKTSAATATVANVNDAPAGAVTIAGTATQGQTLTVTNTLADADGMGTVSYQWKANGMEINGATGSSYTLTQSQVGKTITVTASYTDKLGAAETVTSSATATVVNVNDAGTVAVSGKAIQKQVLTATVTDIDGVPATGVTYQWLANGVAISGAANKSMTLGQNQVGKTIAVKVSYTDGQGTVESKTSAATLAVANVNDAPIGTVSITGTTTQGQKLTAANTLTDVDGLGTITYQWKANGATISGATGSSYTLKQFEVGKTIAVTASYTDGQGTVESKTSAATAAVANVNDLPTGSVTVSGTATKGLTLTAANTLADVDGLGKISYQWKADGKAISGATGSTYQLTQTEVGKAITITASYIDSQGTAESKTSAATKAVLNGLTAGTTGNDILMGTYGADRMTGQTGNDLYYVNHASDVIAEAASGGTDTVYSYLSSYTLGANVENGYLMSSAAATLTGNGLANTLRGGVGKDTLDGGAGADTADYSDKSVAVVATLNGVIAVSVKLGGVAEDSIKNIENLSGGSASDNLTGDTLANTLVGNAGNDMLNGLGGNDILRGDSGNDTLTGGTGQDFFRFDAALNRTSNVDRITDFSAIDDTIQLENSIFTKFGSTTTGTLSINYFKAITTGGTTDSNDYIVYNKTTGALYYDADGGADGNTDGIQFATVALVGTAPLTNADFVLI